MIKIRKIIALLLCPLLGLSQENNYQTTLDSLYQSRWNARMPDLESLDTPKLVDLNLNKKDSIVLKPVPKLLATENEVPITPFSFMNTYKEKEWFYYGQNNLIFNQSSFSNWNTGGNNSFGIIGRINYSLSYKNGKHFWDNNLRAGYGMLSVSGRKLRKTEDYINFSSKYGYDLGQHYYYLLGMEFRSQFSAGYNYSSTRDMSYNERISRFMAPAYLNAGMGILYNPNENFQVSISPINGKFTFVLDRLLQEKGRYGLERDGQSMRAEIGALLNAVYRIKIYKDIDWTHHLTVFSNYSHHPERLDIAYNSLLTMKFNRFISTTLSLDLVYDHDQVRNLQMKQVLGIGVAYNLGTELKEKNTKKDKVKLY